MVLAVTLLHWLTNGGLTTPKVKVERGNLSPSTGQTCHSMTNTDALELVPLADRGLTYNQFPWKTPSHCTQQSLVHSHMLVSNYAEIAHRTKKAKAVVKVKQMIRISCHTVSKVIKGLEI